jgi:hypothetical protein
VLSGIRIVDGRVMGKPVQERKKERERRERRRALARLTLGAWFGGGADVVGVGQLQVCAPLPSALLVSWCWSAQNCDAWLLGKLHGFGENCRVVSSAYSMRFEQNLVGFVAVKWHLWRRCARRTPKSRTNSLGQVE